MIEYHPSFETPAESCVLWRYIDSAQFLSLLANSKVHFTRVDQLNDKWEGEASEPTINAVKTAVKQGQLPPEIESSVLNFPKQIKICVFVNCWHENEDESAAMWKLYGAQHSNICIVSSMRKMRAAFEQSGDHKLYCGRIKYIDYRKDHFDTSNLFSFYLHKRKSFAHENEVRIAIMDMPSENGKVTLDPQRMISGLDIQVGLKHLISKILVSPQAPSWYVDTIKSVVEKYGLDPTLVRKSDLDDGPLR